LSIDSPSLCQSIRALQEPWPEKEKDRQTIYIAFYVPGQKDIIPMISTCSLLGTKRI
jgi:hypothetical protein